MTQANFLDDLDPIPPWQGGKPEAARLSRQCAAILELLKRGPCTNADLSKIALKYTSRISDLRKAGHKVEVVQRDTTTGLVTYKLRDA